jgi:hypothetical protein
MLTGVDLFEDLVGIDELAAVGLGGGAFELFLESDKCRVTLSLLVLQEPKAFAHHFAGGLITAGGDALLYELFEFGRERNVQAGSNSHTPIIGQNRCGCQFVLQGLLFLTGPRDAMRSWLTRLSVPPLRIRHSRNLEAVGGAAIS